MNVLESGNLVTVVRSGEKVAEILVTNRGVRDERALDAFLEGFKTWRRGFVNRRAGIVIESEFVAGWLRPHANLLQPSPPFGFVVPVHLVYDIEYDKFDVDLWDAAISNIARGRSTLFPELYTGGIVTDVDFIDRDKVITKLWERVQQGRHVILSAPRRFGKTSLMKAVESACPDSWQALYIDIESVASEQELAHRIERELQGMNSRMQSSIHRPRAATHARSRPRRSPGQADELVRPALLHLRECDRPILILLDEVTYMLENVGQSKSGACLDVIDRLARSPKVRFVISASTEIKAYLSKHGLELGLRPRSGLELPPLDRRDAELMINALFAGQGVRPPRPVVNRILEYASPPVPYFIQIFVAELEKSLRHGTGMLSPASLDTTYRQRVIGPDCRRSFDSFEWHLGRYYQGEEGKAARLILREISRRERGIPKGSIPRLLDAHGVPYSDVDGLLARLRYDMYVATTKDRVHFAHRMLRDYWSKFHAPKEV